VNNNIIGWNAIDPDDEYTYEDLLDEGIVFLTKSHPVSPTTMQPLRPYVIILQRGKFIDADSMPLILEVERDEDIERLKNYESDTAFLVPDEIDEDLRIFVELFAEALERK
jgi:hypothetical protein